MSIAGIRTTFKEKPYLWAYAGGTVLLVACSITWWFTVYIGPQHVFWSMIRGSLSTQTVTMSTSRTSNGETIQQLVRLDTGPAARAQSLVTIKQGKTTVKSEIIGTKTADYTRYTDIASTTKTDTSKVINVWAKSDDAPQTDTQTSGHQLYSETTLGIGLALGSTPIAIGKVTPDQRGVIYDFIRNQNVYNADFSKVKKQRKNGRLLYTYNVKIQTILYISMMKQFATDLGLHELDSADPNSYQNQPTMNVSVTVDALSHQLTSINFSDLGYSQNYSAYNVPFTAAIPKQTISTAELQARLTAIGQQIQQ